MKISVGVPLAAHALAGQTHKAQSKKMLLVGAETVDDSTGKGIYAYTFDSATGELKPIGLAAESENPTFLALSPDGRFVFAANEIEHYEGKAGGAVTSFRLDRVHGKLTKINQVASHGAATCHVSTDHRGHCVFAASYTGGSAASYTAGKDGHLSEAVSFVQFAGSGPTERQAGPHAHRVTVSPDDRFLLVNDLGTDSIHIYHLDAATAKLTPNDPPNWKAKSGAGPRALRFHPNGRWVYCLNEMNSTANVMHWDARRGVLTTVQDISVLAPGQHTDTVGASEIVLDNAGQFAYAASRLDNYIAVYSVSQTDGTLTLLDRTPCGGTEPRHIALDPGGRWMLVANQASDTITVFARDGKTGHLAATGKSFPHSRPQCLVFA